MIVTEWHCPLALLWHLQLCPVPSLVGQRIQRQSPVTFPQQVVLDVFQYAPSQGPGLLLQNLT